ncbi:uncharacterized protein LAJ45_08086 [Morchella importuna]|uniref:uncharacterized protein n=1 Tax=Morchella importuna TaxID=1174673 RepID=UPI001E8E5DFC|nr:uncharacterized protein LAJ45_08086 [Morchella importuna]KAH8147984.1 hypothetical protein LAJ45_08086 [Morchella importuna]
MSWDDSVQINSGWGASATEPQGHTDFPGGGDNACDEGRGGGPGDGACRHCGVEGHFARECPDKPANDGACFNCGQQGHSKAECTEPRVFSGACRHCAQEGHMHKDCPNKPPEVCRNCRKEGHLANDCTNNRYIEYSRALEKSAEEAWDGMALASEEDDFDAFKICMLEYIRACPGAKFNELESSFRSSGWNYYLYALTREPEYHECIVGPNGELDAKYVWTLNKSPKPRRSKAIKDRMDPTAEGNLARLAFAGEIMPETKPFCHTCRVKGHSKRGCEVEVPERDRERVVLKCGNCDALDHRLRDCTLPRKPDYNPMECKNCHEEGHKASDCPMPRVADENTECRKCNEKGHFSRECPQGGGGGPQVCFNCGQEGHRSSDCTNEKVIKCRNCDVYGHSARECPMPKDISRIKCNNCGEMGHYNRDCKNPTVEQESGGYESYSYGGGKETSTDAPAWGGKETPTDAPGWNDTPATDVPSGW